ncbi:MAG: Multidrug resistance ABC transporter ATP-binding and permease protein [Alphaproteobacteria bacterium MarineAlpha2_Bin1]|nr:MAG: Multidrug resistance ABC transporter ATP-binding and permease protein [Alphaproteobacteria bacterium MarineAlpha2_Bin1]
MFHSNNNSTNKNSSYFRSIWNIYKYCFSEDKFSLSLSILLMFISGIFESIGILIIIPIIEILTGRDPNELHLVSKLLFDSLNFLNIPINIVYVFVPFFILILLKSLGIIISNNYVNKIVHNLTEKNRKIVISSIATAEWKYFTKTQVGLISNVINLETQGIAFASKYLVIFLNGVIQSLVYIITAFIISFTFSFGAIISGFLLFIILNELIKITKFSSIKRRDLFRQNAALSTDWITNIKAFKAMNLDNKIAERMTDKISKMKDVDILLSKIGVWIKGLQEPIGVFFLIITIIVSVEFFNIELSALIVSIALFYRVFGKVAGIQSSINALVRGEAEIRGVENLTKSLNSHKEKYDSSKNIPNFKNKIRVSNLYFSYDDKEILKNVNCEINEGKITGIIGPSGAGKTSFIDLIIGLQESNSGEIFIGEENINSIDIRRWRDSIGYVPQTFTLLYDTIKYNITLGDPNITDEDIYWALDLSGAIDFVNNLPNKINESIGQSGQKISGGQMQRLALSRALIRKPKLLILDEATSALDPGTEKSLCKTFSSLTPNTTIIAISHRSAIEKISDVTYYLNEGKLTKI